MIGTPWRAETYAKTPSLPNSLHSFRSLRIKETSEFGNLPTFEFNILKTGLMHLE